MLSDFKVNFRLRDFLLDVLACLVPGLIFIIAISILVGLLFVVLSFPLWSDLTWANPSVGQMFKDVISSFSTQFWFANFLIFASYFCGHALYRKTPKRPDYASFLRIRDKIFREAIDESKKDNSNNDQQKEDGSSDDEEQKKWGTWVVEKNKGVVADEVQFPYSNLKHYLKQRGFKELSELIDWGPNKINERSKSFINKWKIRLAFFYPEQTLNLVRNEAHIRLASSVWYAAGYVVKVAYFCNLILIPYLILLMIIWDFPEHLEGPVALNSVILIPGTSIDYIQILIGILFGIASYCWISGYLSKKAIDLLSSRWVEMKNQIERPDTIFYPKPEPFPEGKLKGLYDSTVKAFFYWLLDLTVIWNKCLKKDSTETLSAYCTELTKEHADLFSKKLRALWLANDRGPMFCSLFLLAAATLLLIVYSSGGQAGNQTLYLRYQIFYLILLIFILFGALFAKHRVEETIHYQRIREVFYVLETAYISDFTSEGNLAKHRQLFFAQRRGNTAGRS
jgi:hypothetical protein